MGISLDQTDAVRGHRSADSPITLRAMEWPSHWELQVIAQVGLAQQVRKRSTAM